MGWSELWNMGDLFQVPQSHPEIARRLSLILPAPPTQLRAGDTATISGVLINAGDRPIHLIHTGWAAALLWDGTGSAAVGGELGWSTALPEYATLSPGQALDLRVRVTARVLYRLPFGEPPPLPLATGTYNLRAYCHLDSVSVDGEEWDGWVLSPSYHIAIIEP